MLDSSRSSASRTKWAANSSSDAFQEIDITGITMPITKLTFASKPRGRSSLARSAIFCHPPNRDALALFWSSHHQRRANPPTSTECDWNAATHKDSGKARGSAGISTKVTTNRLRRNRTIEVRKAHDHSRRKRAHDFRRHEGSRSVRVALATLVFDDPLSAIGCFQTTIPLNLGIEGMHGEAWVKSRQLGSDLPSPSALRFDDSLTGDRLRHFMPEARKIHIDPTARKLTRTGYKSVLNIVKRWSGGKGTKGPVLEQILPHIEKNRPHPWQNRLAEMKGDSALATSKGLRTPESVCRALINDMWKEQNG